MALDVDPVSSLYSDKLFNFNSSSCSSSSEQMAALVTTDAAFLEQGRHRPRVLWCCVIQVRFGLGSGCHNASSGSVHRCHSPQPPDVTIRAPGHSTHRQAMLVSRVEAFRCAAPSPPPKIPPQT